MKLIGLFKKKDTSNSTQQIIPEKAPVSDESIFLHSDSLHSNVTTEGNSFEHKVITFENRKKTAIPSKRGLYPAEILLLDYCSKGTYPNPKNGYPRFWWFDYGIHDVDAALKTLEERGYIIFTSAKNSINNFTVQQLKDLLVAKGQLTNGKKAELVARVTEIIPEEDLLASGLQLKYVLTEIGRQELDENAYVPYMHSIHNKTTEDGRLGMEFNVWSINKLLGTGDKSKWRAVVEEQERKMSQEIQNRDDTFKKDLNKFNPELYKELCAQNQQLVAVQKASDKYNQDKDLDSYIAFWEMLWENGGLKFEGSKWHFELPDLYIKAKRYDDALAFVSNLKVTKLIYADKSDIYIKKIEKLKTK